VDIESGPGDGTLYNVVVVRGHRSNRARPYDAGDGVFDKGEVVAIEGDAGGPGTGVVVQPNRRELFRGRLPRVIRRLHENEVIAEPRGKRREQEVFRIARHVASSLDLPIKIVRSQAEPSGKTVVFFACEERIDFRELYRRVSAAAQGRIELRQVGVRDAAKMLGGVAPCGLQLCCTSFLTDFAPVSIKMAKEQGLVLNPQRVSGLCGRLLCCLTYEDELYRTQRKLLPKLGKRVLTPGGPGKVRDVDVLSQTVRVALDTGEVVTINPADITPMFPSQQSEERSDRQDGRCERRRREQDDPGGERRRSASSRRRAPAEESPQEPAKPPDDEGSIDE
jgi:cell fate regulator YaaT (PSP1 superfamily)